mgnify:CR=1 FL=1
MGRPPVGINAGVIHARRPTGTPMLGCLRSGTGAPDRKDQADVGTAENVAMMSELIPLSKCVCGRYARPSRR